MRTISLGGITIDKVFEMQADMPIRMAFSDLSREDLAGLRRWYDSDELTDDPETALIRISVHSYVLRSGGMNILVDSCNGNDKTRSVPFAHQLNTPYLELLAAQGLRPQDINLVLCTHLHGDHVGWNTRLENGRWVPTFPNARYLFTRRDHDFYATQQHEALHREAYDDSILPVISAGLADLVDADHLVQHQIGDGVWLQPAHGHSPGSVTIHAQRGGREAVFSGDAFHHPVQLVRPSMHFFADEDPVEAAQTRARLFDLHADADTVIFPAHFPGRSAGQIRRDGSAYRFEFLPEA